MKRFINTIDALSGIGGWLSAGFMSIALLLALAEIATRSFLGRTLYIADEYSGYLMALMTLIGLAYTLRERGHIRMMFLVHVLKGRAKTIYNMICLFVGFLFCIAFVWFTWDFFWDSVVNKSQSMQLSETYLAIPQSFCLWAVSFWLCSFWRSSSKGWPCSAKKQRDCAFKKKRTN